MPPTKLARQANRTGACARSRNISADPFDGKKSREPWIIAGADPRRPGNIDDQERRVPHPDHGKKAKTEKACRITVAEASGNDGRRGAEMAEVMRGGGVVARDFGERIEEPDMYRA
jgi:hypothetical protein